MFSLLYGRGRYYTSSERVQNLWVKTKAKKKQKRVLTNVNIQTWSELLAPLVNMIKEGCENLSALLILLIFYLKNSQKSNLSLENKNLKWEEISL